MSITHMKIGSVVGLSLLLASCAGVSPPPSPAVPSSLLTASPTLAPTVTAPPAPTPTPSPMPTATSTPIPLADTLSDVSYRLPLVVQHVTETSAVLFFELDRPAEGKLLYWPSGPDAGGQAQIDLDPQHTRHQITLDGLLPDTDYQAEVALVREDGLYQQPGFMGQSWGPIHFRTPSGQRPLRIGVIGDAGFGDQVTYGLAEQMATYDLDFVLHTGDVVYRIGENADPYEAYALKWYLPFAPLLRQMPVYTVIGNHDVEAAALWQGIPFYYQVFPPFADPRFEPSDYQGRNQWYAFAYGDVQFVMLDTQTFFGEGGRAEQDAWLQERLSDPRFAVTIPVFHVPPYTSGLHGSDGLTVRSTWSPQFTQAGVPLVLSGHDHNYERLTADNVTYIVSGGGSAVLYSLTAALPESQFFAKEHHFVLVEIYDDRIELQAIALGGQVIDRATLALR